MSSEHPARETLNRAVAAHRAGQAREALALAEAAFRMVTEIPGAAVHAGETAAFFGFMTGTAGRRPAEGLAICRDAVARAFWDPRAFEYFAGLQLALGDRTAAVNTCERGLAIAPEDNELLQLRQSMGVRRRPPLFFLTRNHPLNKALGKWLARQRRDAAMAARVEAIRAEAAPVRARE